MMEVKYYRQNNDQQSSVVAYFGLYIDMGEWDIYLSKLRLIHKRDGGKFIAPPAEKFTDNNGVEKYANFFWFGKKSSDKFQEEAMRAIDAWVAKQNPSAHAGQPPQQQPPQQQQYYAPSGVAMSAPPSPGTTRHYTAPLQAPMPPAPPEPQQPSDDLPF